MEMSFVSLFQNPLAYDFLCVNFGVRRFLRQFLNIMEKN